MNINLFSKIVLLITAIFFFAEAVKSSPVRIVQTAIIDFPVNGKVIVKAREEIGKFPEIVFISKKSNRILLKARIQDKEKDLIPIEGELVQPELRFRTVGAKGFESPLIMAVGVCQGGSDDQFYMNVFGEIRGKITLLNEKPLFANDQGGYYLGYLNKKLGYGLVVWNFVWGSDKGEWHGGSHHYQTTIYKLQNGKFRQLIKRVSRKKYDSLHSVNSLREIEIGVSDQRRGVPKIKDIIGETH